MFTLCSVWWRQTCTSCWKHSHSVTITSVIFCTKFSGDYSSPSVVCLLVWRLIQYVQFSGGWSTSTRQTFCIGIWSPAICCWTRRVIWKSVISVWPESQTRIMTIRDSWLSTWPRDGIVHQKSCWIAKDTQNRSTSGLWDAFWLKWFQTGPSFRANTVSRPFPQQNYHHLTLYYIFVQIWISWITFSEYSDHRPRRTWTASSTRRRAIICSHCSPNRRSRGPRCIEMLMPKVCSRCVSMIHTDPQLQHWIYSTRCWPSILTTA